LAGVPVAVKDVFLTRGVLTTAGSRVLAQYVPDADAAVWQRLAAAGAGLLGKTTTHEFAYGTASPPTTNPWNVHRTPGGSSGGSAAALASRMAPVATGTDTAGSLRIPAGACGVCTLRSANGRVSRYGVIPLSPSFDIAGPLARRMLDISMLMRVLAGYDPRDPGSRNEAVPGYPTEVPTDLTGIRIGLPIEMSWREVDESIATVCLDTLGLLVERSAQRLRHDHSHLYTPQVRERVQRGEAVSAERYEQALRLRGQWEGTWRDIMSRHRLTAIAHPTIDAPPPLIDANLPPKGPSIRPSVPWSIAGFPALSVPAGLDDRGLPVGLSLAGLPEREAGLLGLGIVIDEEVRMWRRSPWITPERGRRREHPSPRSG